MEKGIKMTKQEDLIMAMNEELKRLETLDKLKNLKIALLEGEIIELIEENEQLRGLVNTEEPKMVLG